LINGAVLGDGGLLVAAARMARALRAARGSAIKA